MRKIVSMDTVQIEITSFCVMRCSNCTRFCGHHPKPYHMAFDYFKRAIDSMIGFPKMVGLMGGEPLLHPEFEKFCRYASSQIMRDQLGLWTAFPEKYKHHREVIFETFGHVFLNDHSRPDIFHAPLLVGADEVIKDEADMWMQIDDCWIQNSWSASINPHGAFFCEIAAARSMLFGKPDGWPVEKGWWKRTPKDYGEQMRGACPKCGGALTLPKRSSWEEKDDVSPENLELLKKVGSLKVKSGDYVVSDLIQIQTPQEMFKYKDMDYRQSIADKYDMYLSINDKGFWSMHLKTAQSRKSAGVSIYEEAKREYESTRTIQ